VRSPIRSAAPAAGSTTQPAGWKNTAGINPKKPRLESSSQRYQGLIAGPCSPPVEGVEPEHHGAAGSTRGPRGGPSAPPRPRARHRNSAGPRPALRTRTATSSLTNRVTLIGRPSCPRPSPSRGRAEVPPGGCSRSATGASHTGRGCRPRYVAPSSSATEQIVVAGSPGTCRVANLQTLEPAPGPPRGSPQDPPAWPSLRGRRPPRIQFRLDVTAPPGGRARTSEVRCRSHRQIRRGGRIRSDKNFSHHFASTFPYNTGSASSRRYVWMPMKCVRPSGRC